MIEKYSKKLTMQDIGRIGLIFNKSYEEQTSLVKDAINAIYFYKKEANRDGFIKLSVLDDLLPNEDILFLILTGQEEKILTKIEEVYFKNDRTFYKEQFLKDLEILQRVQNVNDHFYPFSNLQYLIREYPASGMKKEVMADLGRNLSQDQIPTEEYYLPYWSIFSKERDEYAILVTNKYLSNYKVELSNSENFKQSLEEKLTFEGKKCLTNSINNINLGDITYFTLSITSPNNEIIRLLGILKPEVVKIREGENTDQYILRLEKAFKDEINIYQLALGLDKRDIKSQKEYLDLLLKELSEKNITSDDIYNYNFVIDFYLQDYYLEFLDDKEKKLEFQQFIEDYKNQMINLLTAQGKEELIVLVNRQGANYKYFNPFSNYKEKNMIISIQPKEENDNYYIFEIPNNVQPVSVSGNINHEYGDINIEELGFYNEENNPNRVYIRKSPNTKIYSLKVLIEDYLEELEDYSVRNRKKN